jgi:hypothetical protein
MATKSKRSKSTAKTKSKKGSKSRRRAK